MVALFTKGKGWRRTLGVLVVALYALCVMLPTATVAASHFPVPEHCLGEHHHGVSEHLHPAGEPAIHDHAGTSQNEPIGHDHGQSEKCCGLFGVTALAQDFQVVAVRLTQGSNLVVAPAESLLGSRGNRIDRPPRNFLSL
jgi:hypothetical protein